MPIAWTTDTPQKPLKWYWQMLCFMLLLMALWASMATWVNDGDERRAWCIEHRPACEGGEVMAQPDFWRGHWERVKKAQTAHRATGYVAIWYRQGRLQVLPPTWTHPKSEEDFRYRALELGGAYRALTGVWSFPGRARPLVVRLCEEFWPERLRFSQPKDTHE